MYFVLLQTLRNYQEMCPHHPSHHNCCCYIICCYMKMWDWLTHTVMYRQVEKWRVTQQNFCLNYPLSTSCSKHRRTNRAMQVCV